MDLIEDLDTRGIKPGDFVIRKAHGAEPVEDSFQWHPLSFGQVIELVVCDPANRKEANCPGHVWMEVTIMPFSSKMPPKHEQYLQWTPEECIVISGWTYCLLGVFWPLIRLVYRKPFNGQKTDY